MKIVENEVYTTKEVAQLLKISMPTVKRMLKDGRLKSARIGRQHRFLGQDLLAILSGRHDLRKEAAGKPGSTAAPRPLARVELSSVETRQRDYMLGKKTARDVYDDDGDVLFPTGLIITEDKILEAKKVRKLMELFAALEQGA